MIALDDLKLALRVDHDTDDDYLTRIEAGVVAYLERKTGQSYEGGTFTEYVRGSDDGVLWLSRTPSSVTSVKTRAYPGGEETTITAAADDGFEVRGSRLYRKGGYVWSSGYEHVVVYAVSASDDPDVELTVYSLCARWYELRLGIALGTVAPEIAHMAGDFIAARARRRV